MPFLFIQVRNQTGELGHLFTAVPNKMDFSHDSGHEYPVAHIMLFWFLGYHETPASVSCGDAVWHMMSSNYLFCRGFPNGWLSITESCREKTEKGPVGLLVRKFTLGYQLVLNPFSYTISDLNHYFPPKFFLVAGHWHLFSSCFFYWIETVCTQISLWAK